jgi:hypothetical protein
MCLEQGLEWLLRGMEMQVLTALHKLPSQCLKCMAEALVGVQHVDDSKGEFAYGSDIVHIHLVLEAYVAVPVPALS